MNGVLAAGVRLEQLACSATQEISYRVSVIADEEVPLAAGPVTQTPLFGITIAAMTVLLIGMLSAVYLARCSGYRQRVRQLCRGMDAPYNGWNLKRLKEAAAELEWRLAGEEE